MIRSIIGNAKLIWAGIVLSLGAALYFLPNMGVDNSVEIWFPKGDPSVQKYHAFQSVFGNDEQVLVGIQTKEPLHSMASLELVEKLVDIAEAQEGVARAIAVTNTPFIDPDSADITIQTLEELGFSTAKNLRWKEDLGLKQLLGKKENTALIIVQMEVIDDFDAKRDALLLNLRTELDAASEGLRYGGIGIIYSALNKASTVDSVVFILGSYILIAILLWRLFGNFRTMVLTLTAVGIGATWLMGIFAGLGNNINMVNMVLPTLVLVIGVSGCVHMLMHVAHSKQEDPIQRAIEGITAVLWPCFFNTITTCLGFLALGFADLPVIQELGWFGGLGLLLAFFSALILSALGGSRSKWVPIIHSETMVDQFVIRMASWGQSHQRQIMTAGLFIALISALGITKLEVDTYSIGFMKEASTLRKDSDWLEEYYGSYTPVEFVIETPRKELVTTLQEMYTWENKLRKQEDIGYIRSLVTPVTQLHQSLKTGDNSALPADLQALEQLLFLVQIAPDSIWEQVAYEEGEHLKLRMTVGIPMLSAKGFEKKLTEMQELVKFSEANMTVSGYIPLYIQMMSLIVSSQLSSFGFAFLIIFTAIGLLFRSFRMALLSIPANLLPVLMTLGLMGWLGIRLDVATVTISAIVLGLVVDDTMQFLYRLKEELKTAENTSAAVYHSVCVVGRPMFITTVVLGAGFSILGLASITSVAYFGLLLAFALISALFCDLLILPALVTILADNSEKLEEETG